jgi:hypothetical protein
MDWTKLGQYTGPLALACFAGVMLGGIALSFFWKKFGPWNLLEECKKECARCREARDDEYQRYIAQEAKVAELTTRYSILLDAVQKGGLGLVIGRRPDPPLIPGIMGDSQTSGK